MKKILDLSHIDPRKPYQRAIDDMAVTDILDEYILIQDKNSQMSRMQRDYIVTVFKKIQYDYNNPEQQTEKGKAFFEELDKKYINLLTQ